MLGQKFEFWCNSSNALIQSLILLCTVQMDTHLQSIRSIEILYIFFNLSVRFRFCFFRIEWSIQRGLVIISFFYGIFCGTNHHNFCDNQKFVLIVHLLFSLFRLHLLKGPRVSVVIISFPNSHSFIELDAYC